MVSSISKNLNIARAFFGSLAGLLLLTTIIVFGANMDYANFPGSNMVLKVYPENDDNEGDLFKMPDGNGFALADSFDTQCAHNFAEVTSAANGAIAEKLCQGVKDDEAQALILLDEDGKETAGTAQGWTIMPPCVKTGKLSVCAPFGVDSPLSGLGQAFFGVLAINAVLYAAHTGVQLGKPESRQLNTANILFGLNVVWGILAFSLFVWAAVAWRGLCDKIDAGLGRHVVDAAGARVYGCATTYCTISYGGFMASFATALVVYRIPDILVMFGVLGLESADDGL